MKLHTYTGEKLDVVGTIVVDVEYKSTSFKLNLVIVHGDGPSLIGRDWLQHILLDWVLLNILDAEHSQLEKMLAKHSSLFQLEISGTTAGGDHHSLLLHQLSQLSICILCLQHMAYQRCFSPTMDLSSLAQGLSHL